MSVGEEGSETYCQISGLNARIYDPELGRMLSADPTVPGAMNGQAFNRYSYVTNRPLTFTDPSGYYYCDTGCGQHLNCTANCFWQGGVCVDCISPAYSGWDAVDYFLPFGGLGGIGGGGVGGGGAAQNIGNLANSQTQTASLDSDIISPVLETITVTGCCLDTNGDFPWDDSWANTGFLQWNGTYIDDRPLGNGGGVAAPALKPWPFSDFLVQTVAFSAV